MHDVRCLCAVCALFVASLTAMSLHANHSNFASLRASSPFLRRFQWHTGCIFHPGLFVSWFGAHQPPEPDPESLAMLKVKFFKPSDDVTLLSPFLEPCNGN